MKRLVVLLAAVTVALAGCNPPPVQSPAAQPPALAASDAAEAHNDTDVMFLQMMIAHHGPAQQMAGLAIARARRADVKTLAAAVKTTQADESRTMTEWLRTWNRPLESTAGADAHAHHGGVPTGESDLAALNAASDAEFDQLFLRHFSGYQQNAVTLAQMEIRGGLSVKTLELANRVDRSRRGQIELMSRYLHGSA